MALINCPACGNMISDKASICPKCGYQLSHSTYRNDCNNGTPVSNPGNSNRNPNQWLYAIIAFLATLLLVCGIAFFFYHRSIEDKEGLRSPQTELVTDDDPGGSASSDRSELQAPAEQPPRHAVPSRSASPAVENLVDDGVYYLSGVITHKQNYYFDMKVNVYGRQATGEYIVRNGENVYVTLSGSIDANGNMKLTEYKNGQPTGYYFTGRFDESVYSGTYRCTTRKLIMNFTASTD